jgi:hypothetical protein
MHSSHQPLRPSLATTTLHGNASYAHRCFFTNRRLGTRQLKLNKKFKIEVSILLTLQWNVPLQDSVRVFSTTFYLYRGLHSIQYCFLDCCDYLFILKLLDKSFNTIWCYIKQIMSVFISAMIRIFSFCKRRRHVDWNYNLSTHIRAHENIPTIALTNIRHL